jgi:hypothetical protein
VACQKAIEVFRVPTFAGIFAVGFSPAQGKTQAGRSSEASKLQTNAQVDGRREISMPAPPAGKLIQSIRTERSRSLGAR